MVPSSSSTMQSPAAAPTMPAEPALLSREAILAAKDLTYEIVDVPEWNGAVRVRGMTADERDTFEESLQQGEGRKRKMSLAHFRAKLVARCVVDAKGETLFTSDAHVKALGQRSAAALARVAAVASRLSGLTEADVEDLATDLGNAPGGDS